MTVSTTLNKAQFDGSGSTGPFTFNFRFLDNSHIVVIKTASSVDTTLTETTDYTLTGAGSYSGGSITLDTALAVGETLTVYRYVPYTQSTDFRNQSAFFAELHEDQFDILTMQAQQLAEAVERSVKVPITSDETTDDYLLTEIQAAATDAASSASEAAGYLDQFTDLYLGSHATEPATDNDGNALAEGAVYWNSTEKNHYTHDGSVWVPWGVNPPDGDKGDVVVSSSGAVWTVQSAEACTGNAATATAGYGSSFRTAQAATEGSIGARVTGYPDAYLFNSSTQWGLYSPEGGTMCAWNRTLSAMFFYGTASSAISADSCTGNAATATYATSAGSVAGITSDSICWVAISSGSIGAVSALNIDLDVNTYAEFKIVLDQVVPATDSRVLDCRPYYAGPTYPDNAFPTGTYMYVIGSTTDGATIGSGTGEHGSAVVSIKGFSYGVASGFSITSYWSLIKPGGTPFAGIESNSVDWDGTERLLTGIRFLFATNGTTNFEARGTWKLYGLRR